MHVKKGDLVTVVTGKDRNSVPARILKVFPKDSRVVVEGRNLMTRHVKGNPTLNTESRIEEVEAPIHVSNVRLYSEKLGKPVRTQKRFVGKDGALFTTKADAIASFGETPPEKIQKVRYSPKSSEIFD